MNDFAGHHVVQGLEVGNFEGADGLYGQRKGLVGAAGLGRLLHPLPGGAERTQHLRPIETLSLAMITEAHTRARLLAAPSSLSSTR